MTSCTRLRKGRGLWYHIANLGKGMAARCFDIQKNEAMKTSKLCVLGSVFAAGLTAGAETPDKFIRYVEATVGL